MSNDSDLIREFLAKKGVTKVPEGVTTMTPRQMREAIGWEPDKMNVYHVFLMGEDGYEWTERITATSAAKCEAKVRASWPESRIINITRV